MLVVVCVALLVWFWPRLVADGMAVPVTLYIAVLGAMVCAALLARLADAVDRARRGVLRGVRRHDRHRQVRLAGRSRAAGDIRLRGACGPDLVGLRGVAAVDHRRILLRPRSSGVGRLCYTGCVTTTTRQAAEHEPIARVLPMLSVPHLDRDFDYLVSAEQSDDAQPGVRVRVRFHGRLVDAFVLERRSDTDHVGKLGWLDRVVSAERVLTADVRRLADAVAARYAGTRADVLRLAVPPRHANVEKQAVPELPSSGRDRRRPGARGLPTAAASSSSVRSARAAPPARSGRRCRGSRGPTGWPRPRRSW